MANTKAPAFQFYPHDFLMDEHVRLMSMAERGVYITLLCCCWAEGSLPADLRQLAKLCETAPAPFRKLWQQVGARFLADPTDPHRLIHRRLDRERSKQLAYHVALSDAGKRGARRRWGEDSHPIDNDDGEAIATLSSDPNGHPNATPIGSGNGVAYASSSSVFLEDHGDQDLVQTSSTDHGARAGTRARARRAGAFLERYQTLHVKLRKGAHYLGKPSLDFQEALRLVDTFDDPTLDKLAFVWLNTDHEFAEKNTRSVARFRSMATWCQEQLIAWEDKHGPLEIETT